MPPAALARAREVLEKLERYELDVFAEEAQVEPRVAAAGAGANSSSDETALTRASTSAARRRLAAQSSLFDLANQKIVDELREAKVEALSAEDAKELLKKLRDRIL